MPVTFTCDVCGELSRPMPASLAARVRTCSRACAGILSRSAKYEDRTCQQCGVSFSAYAIRHTRFCSKDCVRASRRVEGAKWRDTEQIAAYQREYQKKNRQRVSAQALEWSEKNREKRRAIASAYQHRQRVINAGKPSRRDNVKLRANSATLEQTREIFGKANHHCVYCGLKTSRLTLDHYTPIAGGGLHTASNLVPSCKPCNSSKGAQEPDEWLEAKHGGPGLARTYVFLRRGKFDRELFASLLTWKGPEA